MKRIFLLLSLATGIIATVNAQNFDNVQMKHTKIKDSIYLMQGAGGNIGLLIGPEGVFMIDDQYRELGEKIEKAVAKITNRPIKYVFNTHWHFDHAGSNEAFGKKAQIIAHENVRKRLQEDHTITPFGWDVKAMKASGWPVITFDEGFKMYLNNEEIQMIHGPAAHTDGDAFVYFKKANIIHAGDTFVRYGFPFIDAYSGGSIDGMIDVLGKIIAMADENTIIIPGHGALAKEADVAEVRDMLIATRKIIVDAKKAGRSKEELMKSDILADYEKRWSGNFINTERFIQLVYEGFDNHMNE
ncbi:MBL fold metallo-hydrolase [Spongiimicrobium salis]|uniref:MBL fold metallo-hydrolase n=1 Tax=Spongiimicrobium salis TaxID=1667022 RepID=UPI00374CA971